jgi:hypothetical protein
VDDVHGKHRGTFRLTPRALFAASCGVPSLVEAFPGLSDAFAPGVEIAVFPEKDAVVTAAAQILDNEEARAAMGRGRASARCASTPGTGGSSSSCSTCTASGPSRGPESEGDCAVIPRSEATRDPGLEKDGIDTADFRSALPTAGGLPSVAGSLRSR